MSAVLVAGGAGFIGSHLCDALLDRGDTVLAIDNLMTGHAENVEHLVGRRGFTFMPHDVTDRWWTDLVPDVVFNLASPASPADFDTLALEILDVGARGTKNLLEFARRHGARFVQASTSEVYGDPMIHPQPEGYFGNVDPTGPRSCYDEAKRYGEALCAAYRRRGVDARIARIFNTYGPRMRPTDGRVMTEFITAALAGQPLKVHGNGAQTRSFCYVSDTVAGLLALADVDEVDGPVNIGNSYEVSIATLAELVRGRTNSLSLLEWVPMPPERGVDPVRRCPDLTRAREVLGWEPLVPLGTGLARMIDAMR